MIKALVINLIIIALLAPATRAQHQNGNGTPDPNQIPVQKFNPSMVAIVIVLVAALFFMGFFSVYIRNRSFGAPGSIRVIRASFRRRAPTTGLDQEVINSFPTFNYSTVKELRIGKEALECAVCLSEFEEDDTLRLLPKCDHVFHPECIDEWLSSHVTCPVCRTNLVPQPGEEPQAGNGNIQGEISIQVQVNESSENDQSQSQSPPPLVIDRRSKSTTLDRPTRSGSVSSGRGKMLGKFRKSHTTGHALIQPGENVDRFTLRFQDDFHRQVMMNRALNRTTSCQVTMLPRESSLRSGYRTGFGERSKSTAVGRSNSKTSDRWIFFTRTPSARSDTILPAEGDASTSSRLATRMFMKFPSFQRRDVKGDGMNTTLLPI